MHRPVWHTQVTQLEHAMRAKDREVAKAKEDKEAGKAAERERAKVCILDVGGT